MIITFTFEELEAIQTFANERQKAKDGISATDRRIAGYDNIKTHAMGIMGEWAVAKALEIPFHNEPVADGEQAEGMYYRDRSIQSKNLQKYLAFTTLDNFTKDIAILVNPLGKRPDTVRVVGWITKDEFTNKCKKIDFGYGPRWYVPFRALHDISELKQSRLL